MNAIQVFEALNRMPNLPVYFTPERADFSMPVSSLEDSEDGLVLLASQEKALMAGQIKSEIAEYGLGAGIFVHAGTYLRQAVEIRSIAVHDEWIEFLG